MTIKNNTLAQNSNVASSSKKAGRPAKSAAAAAPATSGVPAPAGMAGTVKQKRTRAKGMKTSKDVQIALMFDGIGAVQEMYSKGLASRTTVKRALAELQAQGRGGDTVDALAEFAAPLQGTGVRGRAPIAAGETRTLKAQQVKGTGLFLRLPLACIPDAGKGTLFDIKASRDGRTITVTAHHGDNVGE